MGQYNYKGIVTAFNNVKCDIQHAKLCYGEEENQESWMIDQMQGDWGDIYPMTIVTNEKFPLPIKLKLRWITLLDLKCYDLEAALDSARMEAMWQEQEKQFPLSPFKYVVVGTAAYGEVAIWLRSNENQVLFQQLTAKEVEFDEFEHPVYSSLIGSDEMMKSTFPKEKYESIMRQYRYRYVPLEEYFDGKRWNRYDTGNDFYENIHVEAMEDKCVNGSFDFTGSDKVLKYHTTGMPDRINVKWTEGDVRYFAHFWLSAHYVTLFFESIHKILSDAEIDLLIRLDTRANRYEVAMTAGDMTPRAFIGTQFIVFKYHEEIARSEYFDKEDEEWIW